MPPIFTEESFHLYRRYQEQMHGEPTSPKDYQRFLCDSPLTVGSIPGARENTLPGLSAPLRYGTWHIHYRLAGVLWAVSVVDILPRGISSVYLYYEPRGALSWGTLSALLEIGLLRRMLAGPVADAGLCYYYLGYYLDSCPKLAYKADFRPPEFLHPHTLQWSRQPLTDGQ